VRRQATSHLKQRRQDEYLPALLSELSTPLQAKVDVLVSPHGRLTFRHQYYVESMKSRELAVVEQAFVGPIGGRPVINPDRITAFQEQISTASTIQSIAIEEKVERICELLAKVTGVSIPADAEAWWSWWNETVDVVPGEKPLYRKYSYDEKYVDDTLFTSYDPPSGYTLPAPPPPPPTPPGIPGVSCLVAGTPVWTMTGLKPIQTIQVGDRVLSQDIESGELCYKPVLQTTVRKPAPVLTLKLPREAITCTKGHVFWAEGKGWLRANELKAGTRLHLADDVVELVAIEPARTAAVYNLVVADNHTYFVGESKWLSHDVTPHRPTAATKPGQRPDYVVVSRQ
jgi:hypothetical protein